MKLKKIALKNIRSYKDEEIIFPEGSILLAGEVGSGKSSLLLAVEYSLFGLQPGQRGSSLLRNSTNNGSVLLDLEVGGKNLLIERKLKRNHKTVTNESASITIDGEKIDASLTEIKTKILEYIGYPPEFIKKNNLLYRYTVYTPQEQMKQIILEDAETRLNVLRHVLGIDKYKRIRENLTLLLNHLKEESKVLQGEIKSLDEEKLSLELKKTNLKKLVAEIEIKAQTLEERKSETKNLESEVSQLEGRIKEKDLLEREVEKIKIMVSNKYENQLTIKNEIHELEKSIAEISELFDEHEYRQILAKIANENERIESLNTQYANLISESASLEKQQQETLVKKERIFKIDLCPTCLQDVPEIHKHNILNETESLLSRIKQKIEFLEKEITFIAKALEKEKIERRILEEQKAMKESLRMRLEYTDKAKKRCDNLNKLLENIEQDISLLNKQVLFLKEKIFEFSKFDNLLRLKKSELQNVFREERKAEIALAETNKEQDLTRLEIANREMSIALKEKSKQDLSYLLELYDWLSLDFLELIQFTERNVLIKLRQEFSRVFSKWFGILVPQGALDVRLDESFSPIMIHNGIEMEYSFLSGGERTAIALAYRLALNQIINSMLSKIKTRDIIILDEPTDGFSEAQLDRMHDVLRELKVSQLIIVSHEQKMENFVDNVLRIKKVNDVSSLESHALPAFLLQEVEKKESLQFKAGLKLEKEPFDSLAEIEPLESIDLQSPHTKKLKYPSFFLKM